ncbi:MAG: N-formylglutamate amidohydrolase [Rhodospirillales bacterium]|nr:N-formylglutamate amidohydrolase [Rhodospirillales bacterium]
MTALIGPDDPPPFMLVNPEAPRPILLVCDHASRTIPRALASLGLDDMSLRRHIAWDIGAGELTRRLADRLDAPAVLAGYSRLVIDLNRQPGDPQSILAASDGIVVPGNVGLAPAAQEARAEAFHWPYHHAVDQAFARLRRAGPEPLFFSVHTFTPSLGGEDRKWNLGVLWNRDPRIAVPLIEILRETAGLRVGDNEPYSGKDIAYTLNLHAGAAGLAHCAIEVRQDHCESESDLERFTDLLSSALDRILAMPNVHRIEQF